VRSLNQIKTFGRRGVIPREEGKVKKGEGRVDISNWGKKKVTNLSFHERKNLRQKGIKAKKKELLCNGEKGKGWNPKM